MVQDYLETIPDKVNNDAFTVMESSKFKLQKLNRYLAYHLHRRMSTDAKNSERYQGMFVMLKMFGQMIESRPDPKNQEAETIKPKKKVVDFEAAMDEAAGFQAKMEQKRKGDVEESPE